MESSVFELLVTTGSEAIFKGIHQTSLPIACSKGQLEKVKKIIQTVADDNLRDRLLIPLVTTRRR